jgi:hypothetical protein
MVERVLADDGIALTTWYMLKELMRAPDRAQIPESVSTTDHS